MNTEKLIEEVRKFTVLYDQKDDRYRNSDYKDRVWQKIATTLEAKGGAEECKKKWASIRDQLRRTLGRRKTVSGQAAVRHNKYKYEDILQFLVPFFAERDTISNVSYSEVQEDDEEQEFFPNIQEEEVITTDEPPIQQSSHEESVNQDWGAGIANSFKCSKLSQPSPASTTDVSLRKGKFCKPLMKRKFQRQEKQVESASSQLMAYILAEKEEEKKSKKPKLEMSQQTAVDAFLLGIAPPLKLLNPFLFNQAKGRIFSIVQEFEMKQLMANQSQYVSNTTPVNVHFSPASSSGSVSTPHLSPPRSETHSHTETDYYLPDTAVLSAESNIPGQKTYEFI